MSASAATAPANQGYDLVGSDGGVFNFRASYFGSEAGRKLVAPIAGAATTPDGRGYWLASQDGGVFTFGDARFHGSMSGRRLDQPIVAMAATPDGSGYLLLGADGGVFAFGHARYWGNAVGLTRAPAVGIALTPDGGGYWILDSDGTVWSFGDAPVMKSTYSRTSGRTSVATFSLLRPASGIASTPDGEGYWIVGRDGGVFAYGDAPFYGSKGRTGVAPSSVVGLLPTPTGHGYWLAGSDGNVYPFGDAVSLGNLRGQNLAGAIVAITGPLFGPALSGILPAGVVNETYTAQLHASGGAPPYTFAATGLPPGLSLNPSTGQITGVPTEVGHFSIPATVTDAGGRHATTVLSLAIEYPLISVSYPNPMYVGVTTDTTQGGQGGDDTPSVSGGDGGPYTASLLSGNTLPPGIDLESDGTLRGDAAAPGRFDLRFTDPYGDSVAVPFSIGFAPTGDIATVAGGPNTNGNYGQTTLPAADATTVVPASAFPSGNGGNGDTGPSTGAQIDSPMGVAVEADGTTFVTEPNNPGSNPGGDVRMITPGGVITTFAGAGTAASPDGVPATDASFVEPEYVGADAAGDVFIGDVSSPAIIYEVPKTTGLYHGNTTPWTAGDIYPVVGGPGENNIGSLGGMAVAPDGTVYWSDSSANAIYSVAPNANVGNVVIDSSTPAADGSASLGTPGVLALDPANGVLYLANHCGTCATAPNSSGGTIDFSVVEEFDPAAPGGLLTDIATGYSFDVSGLTVDSLHNVYISDIHGLNGVGAKTDDDEVLRVAPGSEVPVVVAGAPPNVSGFTVTGAGYSNGVAATSTGIDSPDGIAYDPATGNLTIAQNPGTEISSGAEGLRIVSNVEQEPGTAYTPGPAAPSAGIPLF
ncbi:MAG TPA: putative Ig domain-containing protein [Acidimicrobiales bacterium]|nr:putative Ig domain-containing protein [Acidimicrobiales bacterium]